ncbi:uncharacterized protein [Ptychodera flava]|uniref:uncharacterized protein n=1 Tax=Ptychodera flava TaxID=63121 RepID=UPI00396A63E6
MAEKSTNKHVMISHNWDHQRKVIRIKKALEERGYKMWIDLENIRANIDQMIAEGVDSASVVLLCVSEAYKKSRNCRKEAKRAKDKEKEVVLLKIGKNVTLDGWVGEIATSKTWFNLSEEVDFLETIEALDRELASLGSKKDANCQRDLSSSPNSVLASLNIEGLCNLLLDLGFDELTVSICRRKGVTGMDIVNILNAIDLSHDGFDIEHFLVKRIFRYRDSFLQTVARSRVKSESENSERKQKPSSTMSSKRNSVQTKGMGKPHQTSVERIPYVSQKRKLWGTDWSVQVLGSFRPGSHPGMFNNPKHLTWFGQKLLVCDPKNHRIQIFGSKMKVISVITFVGKFPKPFKPASVVVTPEGHYIIGDNGNYQIIICNAKKQILHTFHDTKFWYVKGMTYMSGFIYCNGSSSLYKYDTKDGKLVATMEYKFGMKYPLVATAQNHLLVVYCNELVVREFDTDLNVLKCFSVRGKLYYIQDIDVDSLGNVYICDWRRIVKFNTDGEFVCSLFEYLDFSVDCIAVRDATTADDHLTIAVTESGGNQIRVYQLQV